jgi:hypothetical protein
MCRTKSVKCATSAGGGGFLLIRSMLSRREFGGQGLLAVRVFLSDAPPDGAAEPWSYLQLEQTGAFVMLMTTVPARAYWTTRQLGACLNRSAKSVYKMPFAHPSGDAPHCDLPLSRERAGNGG